jgi:hypothetical protein
VSTCYIYSNTTHFGGTVSEFSTRYTSFAQNTFRYAIQSNRVIRRYRGSEDAFIRVDFRDEDRLQYRWDREVDGALESRDTIIHESDDTQEHRSFKLESVGS